MNRSALPLLVAVLAATLLYDHSHPAFAQDGNGPVKVTIANGLSMPDPRRFAPSPTAQVCDTAASADARQGEAVIRKIAAEERFDTALVLAIARQESGLRMSSVSSAGAVGLMQLMPDTAKRFQVDICNPEDNVRGAIRYLRLLQKKYQNPIYVLAAYNAGEGAVEKNRGIPLYPETVRYVSAVLTDLYGWQPLPPMAAGGQPDNSISTNPKPGDKPETWTQGFVLHVE